MVAHSAVPTRQLLCGRQSAEPQRSHQGTLGQRTVMASYFAPLRIHAGALHNGSPIATSSQPTNREAAYRLSASVNPDVYRSTATVGDATACRSGSSVYPFTPVIPCAIRSAIRDCPPVVGRNVRALVDTAVSPIDPGANRSDSYAFWLYLASLLPHEKYPSRFERSPTKISLLSSSVGIFRAISRSPAFTISAFQEP